MDNLSTWPQKPKDKTNPYADAVVTCKGKEGGREGSFTKKNKNKEEGSPLPKYQLAAYF